MSTSTNGAATIAPVETTDPYELARRSAEADQAREERLTDTFRRQNVIQYAIIGLLALAVVVLSFKYQHDLIVVCDHGGALAACGTAEATIVPSDANIAHALADYVTCLRTVTNDDLRLDECKAIVLDYMTQNIPPNGHAHDEVDAYYRANNPKTLARSETRSVLNDRDHPVVVQRIGQSNTFFMRWIEKTHDFQHGDSYSDHSGSVVIAPPFIPTDQAMLRFNPTGVVVTQNGLL
jgi:type IV secretion system protein VirB5